MTILLNAFAVYFILFEALNVFFVFEMHKFALAWEERKRDDVGPPAALEKLYKGTLLVYGCWGILGLFTVNWPFFLVLLFLWIIPKRNLVVRWISSVVRLCIIVETLALGITPQF